MEPAATGPGTGGLVHDRMAADMGVAAGVVADAFRTAAVNLLGEPPAPPNPVLELLTEHFGFDPKALEAASDEYPAHLQLNFHAGLDAFLQEEGRSHRTVGVHCPTPTPFPPLSLLMMEANLAWAPVVLVPARYEVVAGGSGQDISLLLDGLILFEDGDGPGLIYYRGWGQVDVVHPDPRRATEIVAELRDIGMAHSPYRGQVVEIGYHLPRQIEFLPRPRFTTADEVVLPHGVLEEIEEHTVEVVRAHDVLAASGRHMKRGILLHGRPGTGKTHTIRYLISQMPGATVAVLSGRRAWSPLGDFQPLDLIRELLDALTPGVIILDDVDFIAEARDAAPTLGAGRHALFSLLDLLDGLDDDADLLFVLTTNRPNQIEPAVSARPGRIDQAIEIPLPDAECRRRLLELYTRELRLVATATDTARIVARTEGVTASFIRELVRRAAAEFVLADGADEEGDVVIDGGALERALDEMLDPDRPLTALLMGAEPEHAMATLALITEEVA